MAVVGGRLRTCRSAVSGWPTRAQPAAHQRIRAATDLLETFSRRTFEHADLNGISHITNVL